MMYLKDQNKTIQGNEEVVSQLREDFFQKKGVNEEETSDERKKAFEQDMNPLKLPLKSPAFFSRTAFQGCAPLIGWTAALFWAMLYVFACLGVLPLLVFALASVYFWQFFICLKAV